MYETQLGILIDSPVDGHLDWFHFLAAVNQAAGKHECMHISVGY